MDQCVTALARYTGGAAAGAVRVAVDIVKPTVKAVVSMATRHPEAIVGVWAGYAVGKRLDRAWGLRHLTAAQAKYLLGFIGGAYGYQMAIRRRLLDIREEGAGLPPSPTKRKGPAL